MISQLTKEKLIEQKENEEKIFLELLEQKKQKKKEEGESMEQVSHEPGTTKTRKTYG